MSYTEMLFDSGMYLFFFGFGLLSGLFVAWVESRERGA